MTDGEPRLSSIRAATSRLDAEGVADLLRRDPALVHPEHDRRGRALLFAWSYGVVLSY